MAIYHLSAKPVSRSAGRTATASAAYRAGEKIIDNRTGEIHDYTRRGGVESADIVLPSGAPEWAADREKLWNAAELAEKRKDACVAREYEVALPAELSPEQRRRLALDFAKDMASREGCAVDVAIHAPGKKGDNRNHHAHILRTTRKVGPDGLGAKLDTEQAGRKRKDDLEQVRERWASMTNTALARAGHSARVDHRTLEAQGIDRAAGMHLGPSATAIERRGEVSDKTANREAANRQAAQVLAQREAAARQAQAQREAQQAREAAAQQAREAQQQAEREAARQQARQEAEARRQALDAAAAARARQEAKEAREAKAKAEQKAQQAAQQAREAAAAAAEAQAQREAAQAARQAAEAQQQKMAAGLVTQREQELAARTLAALQRDDHRELERCYMQAGVLRREALQDLADASPQPVNARAIEHRIKQEQNDSARKSGDREPWAFEGPAQHLCRWDAAAKSAESDLEKHIKSDRPTGFFQRGEAKAWDAQKDELERLAKGWAGAAQRVKRDLQTETAARVAKAEAVEAQRAAKNAPQQAQAQSRVDGIAELSKALETALQPHRERERQRDIDHGHDFGR